MRTAFAVAVLCLLSRSASAQDQSQWAPSAGFMLGALNSNDLASVDRLVELMTGYKADLTGRSWDLCAAKGRAGSGHIRLCYAQVRLENGSALSDDFSEGRTESVVIKGFKAERVCRFGPRSWLVAPALGVHYGFGKVSGQILVTEYDFNFDSRAGQVRRVARPSERRPAGEFLGLGGKDWAVIGGASIGATATLGKHLTANVGVYGLEMPGVYKGQVQFVYWPR